MHTETFRRGENLGPVTLDYRSGAEGPDHDPYGWTELTVWRGDECFTYREGSLGYIRITARAKTREQFEYRDNCTDEAESFFSDLTGLTPTQWRRVSRRLYEKKIMQHVKECGKEALQWASGYPGEELLFCSVCKTVLDSTFDESAVI